MKNFPKDFLWGVSTSSYQIEGSRDLDGRGETIWDKFCESPGNIIDKSSGAVACDHVNRFKEDVHLMEELGVKAYRFSTSWSRIQPKGYGALNQDGLDFYKRLVDSLLGKNINPWLCLNHWDLPQGIEDLGGWRKRDNVFRFVEYAEIIAKHFGDRVKNFITHNEPNIISLLGHGWGTHAPGIRDKKAMISTIHHLNLAHGLAVSEIRKTVPEEKIGIVISMQPVVDWYKEPNCSSRLDIFFNRAYTDPLILGSYPELLIEEISPFVENGDMQIIQQRLDFFGLNHYTTMRARSLPGTTLGLDIVKPPPEIKQTIKGWEINPEMFYQQLLELKNRYGNPTIYVTENGCASVDEINSKGKIQDIHRIEYFRDYLFAAKKAIDDGVNLKGYFAWTLLDNFEWDCGFTERFGLVYVDFATLRRIPKESFYYLKNVFKKNRL